MLYAVEIWWKPVLWNPSYIIVFLFLCWYAMINSAKSSFEISKNSGYKRILLSIWANSSTCAAIKCFDSITCFYWLSRRYYKCLTTLDSLRKFVLMGQYSLEVVTTLAVCYFLEVVTALLFFGSLKNFGRTSLC